MLTILAALVPFHKISDCIGNFSRLQIATSSQLKGHVLRNILRPALRSVEGNHSNGVVKFSGQQILDDRFQVGGLIVSLTPREAKVRKIICDQVDGLVVVARYDRWRPIGLLPSLTRRGGPSLNDIGPMAKRPMQDDDAPAPVAG